MGTHRLKKKCRSQPTPSPPDHSIVVRANAKTRSCLFFSFPFWKKKTGGGEVYHNTRNLASHKLLVAWRRPAYVVAWLQTDVYGRTFYMGGRKGG
jgi:hypothetical protein